MNHITLATKRRTTDNGQRTIISSFAFLLSLVLVMIIKERLKVLSLEFAIEYPCELRAKYSEKHLRAWGRLYQIHNKITTAEQSAPTPDKIKFVEDARDELDVLQEASKICAGCPASLLNGTAGEGEAIGCLGRITYPIEGQFEKFLADRVQLALDTIDEENQPRLLRIFVNPESPFDGEATKELRQVTTRNGLRFFDLRIPIKLAREAKHLTTDNIFDMIAGFHSETFEETTYGREWPREAIADFHDFFNLILCHDLTSSERERLHLRTKNYAQYLRLLAALERADALSARVLLD